MGIPKFFRWITERYPNILTIYHPDNDNTSTSYNYSNDMFNNNNANNINIDLSCMVDNLYLDMNGIIHQCSHHNGLSSTITYNEIFDNIFKEINRIVSLVKPAKLLYIAVDGNNTMYI